MYDPSKPFNQQIRSIIESTHPSGGPIVVKRRGKRYALRKDHEYWNAYEELSGTDGIGTKGYIHWLANTIPFGVQDAFAMVADDLMEGGYEPVHLQDHIMMQEESRDRIISAVCKLRDLCVENKWSANGKEYFIIISGGETAILNTLKGFEMGITATGYAKKGEEITARLEKGDTVIGLASSGMHSNGLSFLREELFNKRGMNIDSILPYGVTVSEELTRPTRLYMPALKELLKYFRDDIHGMVHITGGGLAKLSELSKNDLDICIARDHLLKPQKIFEYAYDLGCSSYDMHRRFNNGIGYAIAINNAKAEDALNLMRKYVDADIVGNAIKGRGRVVIESQYENRIEVYE